MFKRLTIEHYRSITQADVFLGNVAIFVGKNSSGKSNVVDSLHFLQEAFRHGLDYAVSQRYGIKSVRQWSPTRPYRIRISVEVTNSRGRGQFTLKLDSSGDDFIVAEEEGAWTFNADYPNRDLGGRKISYIRNKNRTIKFEFPEEAGNRRRSFLETAHLDFEEAELAINGLSKVPFGEARGLRELWNEVQSFEAYSIYANTIRTPQKPSNFDQLSRHGENISTIIKQLQSIRKTSKSFDELNSLMRLVIPNLDSIGVESVGGLLAPKFVMMAEGKKRHSFNVSQISDGSLRLLGLLGALYQANPPSALALEEPEQNINPGYLTIIGEAVKEVAKHRQILITTHSPHLVDHFDIEAIQAVELRPNGTHVGRVVSSQIAAVKRQLFTVGELMTAEGLIPG